MAYKSGFSRQRSRRRRQILTRLALGLVLAGVFAGLGYSSYRSGALLARMEVRGLEGDIARLTSQVEGLRIENDRLRLDLSQARQTADGVKRRYEADVPSGSLANLMTLLRDRLGNGVKEERLMQVLGETENPRACESRYIRKRFAIHITGQGVEEPVTLLEGLIQVSASVPATAEDPVKAATVTIARAWSSQPIKVTGMPVRQTIPLNNAELKLTVEASELRGYGTATLHLCGRG